MHRIPYQRTADHYDERIITIDEQICALIKQRKLISNNHPGYPPVEQIISWSEKFELYEEFLKSLFNVLGREAHYRPRVEPDVFRKYIPVLKTVEKDEEMYTVTFIRQYDNASVIFLQVDLTRTESTPEQPSARRHRHFELVLGAGYDCRAVGGGGSNEHHTYRYVVTPPLPDDTSGVQFVFQESTSPFGEFTGYEVTFE